MNGLAMGQVFGMVRHALRVTKGRGTPLVWDINFAVINRCNQNCPMCNAGILNQLQTHVMTLEKFRRYVDMIADLNVPTCTISGGEPTLVPDMPAILQEAARRFPVKVILISNFYGKPAIMHKVMEAALRSNVHVICSFDGFDEVADRLRGAESVSRRVTANLELVTRLKSELASRSTLEMHTVLSDSNLGQVADILALSQQLGWVHTVAPVNSAPQELRPATGIGLSDSAELREAIEHILKSANVKQLHAYVRGIPDYARGSHGKYCPYLSPGIRNLKVFLEPNGDVSLCDRRPIGNLNSESLAAILQSDAYRQYQNRAKACGGCWLSCFTEPALAVRPIHIIDALTHRVGQVAMHDIVRAS